jgi:hypothetical protein
MAFPSEKRGVGCIAPYSIVPVMGTNVFLGRDDFYIINGNRAEPVDGGRETKIRQKFFEIVGKTEAENVWGFENYLENEIIWIANTTEGKFGFVWDYKTNEWVVYQYQADVSGAGRGAI